MEAHSTHHGGHTLRLINSTETLAALDDLLYELRNKLTPVHVASAAIQLERLQRQERFTGRAHTPLAFKVQKIAAQLAAFAEERAPRLTVGQVACVVRGLSSVQHAMSQELLLRLAAVLIANDCERLRFGSDQDWCDLAHGFSRQRYSHEAFWQSFCDCLLPRVAEMESRPLAGILDALSRAGFHHEGFTAAAADALTHERATGKLPLHSLVDLLSCAAHMSLPGPLTAHIEQRLSMRLDQLTGKQLSLTLESLTRLRRVTPELLQQVAAAAAAPRALDSLGGLLHVSRLAQGIAKGGDISTTHDVLGKLAGRALPMVQACRNAQELTTAALAFGRVQQHLDQAPAAQLTSTAQQAVQETGSTAVEAVGGTATGDASRLGNTASSSGRRDAPGKRDRRDEHVGQDKVQYRRDDVQAAREATAAVMAALIDHLTQSNQGLGVRLSGVQLESLRRATSQAWFVSTTLLPGLSPAQVPTVTA